MIFYRQQHETGITFEEMKKFNSTNWTTDEQLVGLAAASDPDDLRDLMTEWYGQEYQGEVVIFEGSQIRDIGDGWLVEPIMEINRVTLVDFMAGDNGDE